MSQYVSGLYNLSYYCLFVGAYKESEQAAIRCLALDSSQEGVKTNLALAYLLQNKWNEARVIYLTYRGKKNEDGDSWNEIFKTDIKRLEQNGIHSSYFNRVLELLRL